MDAADGLWSVRFMTIALAALPGLHDLWAGFMAPERAPAPVPIRPLLDTLGLGLGQTLKHLGQERPGWDAFLAWIAATAGPADPARWARYAAWHAGAPVPAAEAARQEAVLAAPDVLGADELARWDRDGVAVLRGAITPGEAAAVAAHLWTLVGGDPAAPDSWYAARDEGLWVEEFQHPAMTAARTSPRLHKAFAQLYGHADLIASIDRLSFSPPERPGYAFRGSPLHWDANLTEPIALEAQAILCLTDTPANGGALQVVPGFHRRIADGWLARQPDPRAVDLSAEAVTVPAGAGDLVIWRQDLPHAASRNTSDRPRLAQYVTMYPMMPPDTRAWC